MNARLGPIGSLPAKLIALVLIVAFVALGLVGLVLPIIPGLLFLALAAALVARHVPAVDRRLRRNSKLGRYLDQADGFFALGLWGKVQLCGLLCVKGVLDGVVFVGSLLTKMRTRTTARR